MSTPVLGLHGSSETPGSRGLGRRVEPDSHMLEPEFRPWSRAIVHDDGRTVSICWARDAMHGLHSISIVYGGDRVLIGTRMGTRPAFHGRRGYVVLRMIVEHTTIRLREPLRGRRIEMVGSKATALTHTR